MKISRGDFQLTLEQRRFKELIAPYNCLSRFWDWEARPLDEEGLSQTMGVFSHSERIMASFFWSVWAGSDQSPIGLVEAATILERDDLAILIGWLIDPF